MHYLVFSLKRPPLRVLGKEKTFQERKVTLIRGEDYSSLYSLGNNQSVE